MAEASSIGRHRFAVATAAATYVLLFIGGLVTSTGSGLAVPDWPLSFGQVFPAMVGGVLFEHGHRLAASTVGLLTVILTVWTVMRETRPGVRLLAMLMMLAVILQGVLGGVTVLYKLPLAVSVTHACLAQIFFCLSVTMAVVTAPAWGAPRRRPLELGAPLPALAACTTAAIFVQLVLGALVRHSGAGLAIPDFPLAFGRLVPPFDTSLIAIHFAHRVGAAVVSALVITLAIAAVRHRPADDRLVRLAVLSLGLLAAQVTLGALIVWTRRAVVPTTTHLVIGAGLLATCLVVTLRAGRSAVATSMAPGLRHAVPA
ncbi:MAG TPA: COX15/CtaA family protein [Candidatus Eisenbacteria bacterium]|nr:COX15/CtaA family protein [Candidatus Eisenbacteria bacterium]